MSTLPAGSGSRAGSYPSSVSGQGTTGTLILGNYIGTDPTGKLARPNVIGVEVANGAAGTTVGGPSDQGHGNVISGNSSRGLQITGEGTTLTVVAGNRIGTTADGLKALPNANSGVEILIGAEKNTIGLAVAGGGNVISGNGQEGVIIADANFNEVVANRIGLDVNGNALGNGSSGVAVLGKSVVNTVGGPGAERRNFIGGNKGAGVYVGGQGAVATAVVGNYIGTDPTGK